jgi:hypothetical protein
MICVVDQRRRADRPQVCGPCRADAHTILCDIVDLYALLPGELEPGRGGGQRVSGTRTTSVPVRLTVLDKTLRARHGSRAPYVRGAVLGLDGPPSARPDVPLWEAEDQIGGLSVPTMLDDWVRDWAGIRREHLPTATVVELVQWMIVGGANSRLEWACDEHPAVDEFVAHVRTIRATLRRVLGQSTRPIELPAPCPTCELMTLQRHYGKDHVECSNCGRLWREDEYRRLCLLLAAEAEAN